MPPSRLSPPSPAWRKDGGGGRAREERIPSSSHGRGGAAGSHAGGKAKGSGGRHAGESDEPLMSATVGK